MVELVNITYNKKKRPILNQVSMTLSQKDFCILFGLPGSGKSTLLHILMGFIPKYQGEVKLSGSEGRRWNRKRENKVRFIPKGIAWEKNMAIDQYIHMIKRMSGEYDKELQDALWEEFHLPRGKKMLEMSYQQNKLIQILAAVCTNPDVLLLDEPGYCMEPEVYDRVLHYLRLWAKSGKIVLMASREYGDAAKYASHYAYLKQGKLISFGQIKRPDYRHKIVTVNGGDMSYLEERMDQCIADEWHAKAFLYTGNMRELPDILRTANCRDCTIEELTIEEELEEDYSGWE